jgi:class 3 adenylate cyclase
VSDIDLAVVFDLNADWRSGQAGCTGKCLLGGHAPTFHNVWNFFAFGPMKQPGLEFFFKLGWEDQPEASDRPAVLRWATWPPEDHRHEPSNFMPERGRHRVGIKVRRRPKPKAGKMPKRPSRLEVQLARERDEALERLTATSEVLQVVSLSAGKIQPVFGAILANALKICEAKFGHLLLYDGESFLATHLHDVPPSYREFWERHQPIRANPTTGLGRIVSTRQVVHIPDLKAERAYIERDPLRVATVDARGRGPFFLVPMLKQEQLIGAIVIYRQEVHPFTDEQIALLQNFAAQAVIAIENARLINDLNELNQQLGRRVAEQVSEIERMSRLRRFLPPQVADLIVASGAEKQLESHRREITALFCDLRGFTGFSEASAPEDVMALLRDYHAAIGEIIIRYSGTLERYAGDGVMVVFNDPVPVDNPALRAVLMALETREAMGALMEKWRQLGHDVGFGIGIAHGFATLGTIGFEGRFDYAAIGTVSNVASRLCDEAKPGQILISPRVFTAVKDAVTVEPMGEFTLKGIGRPLAAYNVLGAKPTS